jgi:hypothetical protein
MRTIGQGLAREDEQAYLHAWNVMGHVLGIQTERMPHQMDDAASSFAQMQAYARRSSPSPDVRPALGQALIQAMSKSIALPIIRNLPVPMTQWLVGSQTAFEIGLAKHASWLTRTMFGVLRLLVTLIDAFGRLFSRKFSISRTITRIMGYHLLTQLLMSQTRPLALPDEVLKDLHHTVAAWGDDPKAHAWLNKFEDRCTSRGKWGEV